MNEFFAGHRTVLSPRATPVERLVLRLLRTSAEDEQRWRRALGPGVEHLVQGGGRLF